MLYTCVLIDDIDELRNHFKHLVNSYKLPLNVIGEADNLVDGIKVIKKLSPDIVFLDVEMPKNTGIEILDFFKPEEINFHLVFVTAHSHYAINAFQLSAIDYILKPATYENILNSIKKIDRDTSNIKYNTFKNNVSHKISNSIILNTADSISVLQFEDILYLKAERAYTNFILKNKKSIVVSKPMIEFEKILPRYNFFRCHRTFLVNVSHISKIDKKNFTILLSSEEEIPLAENKKQELIVLLENQ